MIQFKFDKEFAKNLDQKDPLKDFREEFEFPMINHEKKVYFTGNSLGLMPKKGRTAIEQELNDWAKFGVDGHFEAKNPWYSYHESFKPLLANIVGAKAIEVTPMGGLTSNLHFLMASFYQPNAGRFKILCEAKAFPSDQYALETQVNFHGYSAEEAIIEVEPEGDSNHIKEERIFELIDQHKDDLALVMIGGVNYYSGQVMPMKEITKFAHDRGIMVGFDLAHAFGNIELFLHDWEVDFAAWCSYKYLNSGPGSIAGIFVHERHSQSSTLPRMAGWWGTPSEGRFKMQKGFIPAVGADAWQLSNAPVLSMAVHKVALELHNKAGMKNLVEKQKSLTAYLDFILNEISEGNDAVKFKIITPERRGSQLSILTMGGGKELFDKISEMGVVADWREPNVIRVAPVPIYNSFSDVYRFGLYLNEAIKALK